MAIIIIFITVLLVSIGVSIFLWIHAIIERDILLMFQAVTLTLIILILVGYMVHSHQKEVPSQQISQSRGVIKWLLS